MGVILGNVSRNGISVSFVYVVDTGILVMNVSGPLRDLRQIFHVGVNTKNKGKIDVHSYFEKTSPRPSSTISSCTNVHNLTYDPVSG